MSKLLVNKAEIKVIYPEIMTHIVAGKLGLTR